METYVRARDFQPSRILARNVHRSLIGICARLQEQRLFQGMRHHPGNAFSQFDFLVVEVTAVGVDQRARAVLDSRHDFRVIVPEGCTHLARIEIEITLAINVFNDGPFCRVRRSGR